MMYSVLVVDDEAAIRRGLRVLVDWRRLGFRIEGEASDGKEALESLAGARFDLVLVDIRLPGPSGLDLIRAIRDRAPTPRVIIVSAYAEFDYARDAAALGVRRYLLKPIDEGELVRALREVRKELDGDRSGVAREGIGRLLGRLAHTDTAAERRDLVSRLSAAGLRHAQTWCCVMLKASNPERQPGACAACRSWLERHHAGYLVEDGPLGLVVMLRGSCRPGDGVAARAQALGAVFMREAGDGARVASGDAVDDLVEVGRSFAGARNRLLLSVGDTGPGRAGMVVREHAFSAAAVGKAIQAADTTAVEREIAALGSRIAQSALDTASVHATVSSLLVLLSIAAPGDEVMERLDALGRAEDVAGMLGTLREACFAACREAAASSDGMIATLRDYLREHCTERLTIRGVAGRFGYHPGYLGRAFARKTGMSVRQFVNTCRVDEASRLLLDGALKAYAVAARVGFSDLNHFYAAFRRVKGCTPREYRQRIARGAAVG